MGSEMCIRDSDEVYPERGALLVFPHRQPHAGRPTVAADPPKLIARGELLFVDG